MAKPTPTAPVIFKHSNHPEWGPGVLLEEREGKMIIGFEQGGQRTFKKGQAPGLTEMAELSSEDRAALDSLVRGRPAPRKASAKKNGKKPAPRKGRAAAFPSPQAQVEWFAKAFEGGFEGEAFTKGERGELTAKGKKTYKAGAIRLAQEELSLARFDSATPEELFDSAVRLLQATNIVFPQEGAIPFIALPAEKRPEVVASLRELLHGTGEYAQRVEKFAAGLKLVDKEGKSRETTWPLATLFGATFAPTQHVCVKPIAFAGQATILGMDVDTSKPVTAAKYAKLLAVAQTTEQKLREAGQAPRDLMDVYSFIHRTHADSTPEPTPAAPAPA